MLSGTNTPKLLVAAVVFTSVMADGCGSGQELVIGGSVETCDKEWTIQREYNMNADLTLCAAKCAGHADCTHFSLSTVGTCTTYRGCDTFRESGQTWDTYKTLEPCETTTEESDELEAPVDVQVALDLVHELEVVLQDMEQDLETRRRSEVVCGDITGKWLCRREDCLWTGRTCHDSSFEPECSDWETKRLCEADTAQGCFFDQDDRECMVTPTPTAVPTATPTATPTEEAVATATDDDTVIADGVPNMAVQAGFRFKECITNAPFGGFAKMILTQFAPSILGDLMNFETDRRRWGFNKNNFIDNIAEQLKGVPCDGLYEMCKDEVARVYQEGLEENQADVAASYPFVSSQMDHFLTCAEAEIPAICTDYQNLACPASE